MYICVCEYIYIYILWNIAAAVAKLLQSCPTLCNPIDGSPPGPTVFGILQARTLEWVAIVEHYLIMKMKFCHLQQCE